MLERGTGQQEDVKAKQGGLWHVLVTLLVVFVRHTNAGSANMVM